MPKATESQTNKEARPAVVAVMGHIDHGKSSLIDYIRKSNVVEKEAGGITQHISAYEIEHKLSDGQIERFTLLDTPGHEAFGKIRTRGAKVADIAVLIVSAEDGVKPQTLEVYEYIKEANMPYIVAITKIDKPSADVNRTKQTLAEAGIYVEGFGGDVPVVELSCKTGQGVEDLMEMIHLMSAMANETADPKAMGSGIIIESRMDAKRGMIGVGIIKNGTVKKGTVAVSGRSLAPLRYILNADGEQVDELGLSSPVLIVGWNEVPEVGAEFITFNNKKEAEKFIGESATDTSTTIEVESPDEDTATLPIILKADTAGSLEAVIEEIEKLPKEGIMPKILSAGVGVINENDVKLAITTAGTAILGFNVKADPRASSLAERSEVEILSFDVIYELTEKVAKLLSENKPKIEVEEVVGTAKILKIFSVTKDKQVLGGKVLSGIIEKSKQVKILRRDEEIGRGKIKELQQSKVSTEKVDEGYEFGALIESKTEIATGDTIEVVVLVTK